MVGTGMLWFFGSEVLVFFGFLFCLIRAEGFPRVYGGLLGYFFYGMQGFSLFLFSRDFWTFGFSLFFSRSGGSGVLSHGAGFGLGFHG